MMDVILQATGVVRNVLSRLTDEDLPVLKDGRFIQDLVHARAHIPIPIQRMAKVSASQSRPSYSSSDQ